MAQHPTQDPSSDSSSQPRRGTGPPAIPSRSYAATTSGPPKPLEPKTPGLLDPIPTSSFFGTTASSPAPTHTPTANAWAPPKAAATRTAKKAVATPYIELGDDDDEDELSITPAVPLEPRGRTTSSFRPATVVASKGKDKEESWEDEWSTGTSSTQFTSSSQAWTAAASHAMSISRSTDQRRPRRPSSAYESWDEGQVTATEASPPSDRFDASSEDVAPDFGAPATGQTDASLFELMPAWTAAKVAELKGEKGGKGGLYETSMWDFEEVADTPVGEGGKDKYREMGYWIVKERKEEQVEGEIAAKDEGDVAMKEDDGKEEMKEMGNARPSIMRRSTSASLRTSPTLKSADDVDMNDASARTSPSPLPPPPPSLRPDRVFRTITRNELSTIRPHPKAYYSRQTSSWIFFIPLPSTSSRAGIELFRTLLKPEPKPHRWGIEAPPPPAAPEKLSVVPEDWPPSEGQLRRLEGTRGHKVVYSTPGYYPTVIPLEVLQRLERERGRDPVPGQTKEMAMLASMTVIWRTIDGLLFRGNRSGIPIDGKTFSKRMPWDAVSSDIFIGILGFECAAMKILWPPSVDDRTVEGKLNRKRLLRAWLELGLWIEDNRKRFPENAGANAQKLNTRLTLKSSRPALLETLGGDHLERVKEQGDGWIAVKSKAPVLASADGLDPAAEQYNNLGVTPDFADSAIIDVYHEQIRIDSRHGPYFLSSMQSLSKVRGSEAFQVCLASERSKGHWTTEDLDEAYLAIGCQPGSRGADDDYIIEAYNARKDDITNSTSKRVLREALELIARSRKSDTLQAVLVSTADEDAKPKMDFAKACRLLDLGPNLENLDDDSIIMVYEVRIADSPMQSTILREALVCFAEEKNSDKLRLYLRTGSAEGNGGWEVVPSSDRPVGLANISNTCYLNSLLQYFFTVRELRETILQFSNTPAPHSAASFDGEQLNRVGGRLVTKKEVDRSKRFVMLLQTLFNQLIHTSASYVTPETELAYLALVPSKDEAEPKKLETIIIDDDDDDDDAPMVVSPVETEAKSPSVLGKRRGDHLDGDALELEPTLMAVDAKSPRGEEGSKEDETMLDAATRPSRPSPALSDRSSAKRKGTTNSFDLSVDMFAKEAPDGVVEIGEPSDIEMNTLAITAPPLPPRKPKEANLEKEVSSYMAFGRQNDVTECMDNVMFQIECALNPSSSDVDGGDAASLLKRTFYGKMRQQLEINDPTEPEPIRVKEEPFFSLLVDVAEEGRNVYDGLDMVFDDSLVDIEGKEARRSVSLVQVPPILQIQLQRVQYDREQQKIFKSNAHMSFAQTISMDRYLQVDPTDAEAVARRARTNDCRREMERARARLHELTKAKQIDIAQSLRGTHDFLSNQDDLADLLSTELAEGIVSEALASEEETAGLKRQIASLRSEIEATWIDHKAATFELVAVFIHRGTALSGHYFVYMRDSKNPKHWLKYNDSQVTDADPEEEIFRETTGDSNAYFLVYCRRDRLDAIDSIARKP